MCLVQLPGLLCYRTTVLLLLNKINDDDDDNDDKRLCYRRGTARRAFSRNSATTKYRYRAALIA